MKQLAETTLSSGSRSNSLRAVLIVMLFPTVITPAKAATYYFHNDHLATPQLVTNADQQIVWKGDYDPFGEVIDTAALIEQNIRFPGQYYDKETGLHYNYFRTYNPVTGRYTQSDPIGLVGGLNTYGYAYQNPNRYIDPTGEIGLTGFLVGVGSELAMQIWEHRLNTRCFDLADIVLAGFFGAISPVGQSLGSAKYGFKKAWKAYSKAKKTKRIRHKRRYLSKVKKWGNRIGLEVRNIALFQATKTLTERTLGESLDYTWSDLQEDIGFEKKCEEKKCQ